MREDYFPEAVDETKQIITVTQGNALRQVVISAKTRVVPGKRIIIGRGEDASTWVMQ